MWGRGNADSSCLAWLARMTGGFQRGLLTTEDTGETQGEIINIVGIESAVMKMAILVGVGFHAAIC